MISLKGTPLKNSEFRKPAFHNEGPSEEQDISMGVVLSFFGLPDLTHLSEVMGKANMISENASFRVGPGSGPRLDPRDALDPRKAMTPR